MCMQINDLLVQDVMLKIGEFPVISEQIIFKEAIEEMGLSRLGIVCIVDKKNKLLGIITDGDIRRKLLKTQKPFSALFIDDAIDHSIIEPITVNNRTSLVDAVKIMEDKKIWDLPVTADNDKLVGLLHLHNAISHLIKLY
jgi:CBS domain-containing protein